MPISRINKPRIAITIGDPSGIGPEITLKALASSRLMRLADFFVIGDGFVVDKVGKALDIKLKAPLIDLSNVSRSGFSYGKADPSFGKASIEYIDKALELLKQKKADAIVTAPVNKSSIREAGFKDFIGHTEYLAGRTLTKDYGMMFVGKALKVTVATRHIALKDVPKMLSADSIRNAVSLTYKCLKDSFRVRQPKIGVAGLNPHAGEKGHFGDEEENLIAPVIKELSKNIKGLAGPIPPDVIFFEAINGKYDAVVAMYHDQGLIPFKMLYFKDGVNMTLGLPFVRTSPDHGTAFNIAGKMAADPASMMAAISLASRLAGNRQPAFHRICSQKAS